MATDRMFLVLHFLISMLHCSSVLTTYLQGHDKNRNITGIGVSVSMAPELKCILKIENHDDSINCSWNHHGFEDDSVSYGFSYTLYKLSYNLSSDSWQQLDAGMDASHYRLIPDIKYYTHYIGLVANNHHFIYSYEYCDMVQSQPVISRVSFVGIRHFTIAWKPGCLFESLNRCMACTDTYQHVYRITVLSEWGKKVTKVITQEGQKTLKFSRKDGILAFTHYNISLRSGFCRPRNHTWDYCKQHYSNIECTRNTTGLCFCGVRVTGTNNITSGNLTVDCVLREEEKPGLCCCGQWSDPMVLKLRTKEGVPSVNPEVIPSAFFIQDEETTTQKNITIWWKPVHKKHRSGPMSVKVCIQPLLPDKKCVVDKVGTTRISRLDNSTCVYHQPEVLSYSFSVNGSHSNYLISSLSMTRRGHNKALKPSRMCIIQQKDYRVYPPEDFVVQFNNNSEIFFSWSATSNVTRYTVYWCQGDLHCQHSILHWKHFETAAFWRENLLNLSISPTAISQYSFAISAEVQSMAGKVNSEMVFVPCIFNASKDLILPKLRGFVSRYDKQSVDVEVFIPPLSCHQTSFITDYIFKYTGKDNSTYISRVKSQMSQVVLINVCHTYVDSVFVKGQSRWGSTDFKPVAIVFTPQETRSCLLSCHLPRQ